MKIAVNTLNLSFIFFESFYVVYHYTLNDVETYLASIWSILRYEKQQGNIVPALREVVHQHTVFPEDRRSDLILNFISY